MENKPITIDTKEFFAVSLIVNTFMETTYRDEILTEALEKLGLSQVPIDKIYEALLSFHDRYKTIE